MLERPGEKLEGLANVYLIINVILAVIVVAGSLLAGDFAVFLTGLISGVVIVLTGWLGALFIAALAHAAIRAEQAADYAYKVLQRLERSGIVAPETAGSAPEYKLVNGQYVPASPKPGTPPPRTDYSEEVPAWKRVQQNNGP